MSTCRSGGLSLAIIALSVIQMVSSQCGSECLTERQQELDTVADVDQFCSNWQQFLTDVDQCLDPCTDDEKQELNQRRDQLTEALSNLCESQKKPPATSTPLPECGSDNGWKLANSHIEACTNLHELSDYEYAGKLTKYGVSKNTQDIIDCMIRNQTLNDCEEYRLAFYRELIPRIKFAHLFNADLTVAGYRVKRLLKDQECNVWDWLACHDPLLEALDQLQSVTDGYDLNDIVNYDVTSVTRGLAQNQQNCRKYDKVNWDYVINCRNSMHDKCKLLEDPPRDGLWNGVLDIMYDLKVKVNDKLSTLLAIRDICHTECSNLIEKVNNINACKANVNENTLRSIIAGFKSGTTSCGQMDTLKGCLHGEIGRCVFLEHSAAFDFNRDNRWKLAFDICNIDPDIKSDGRCTAEAHTANRIYSECSFQGNPVRSDRLLDRTLNSTYFCSFLQDATSCYAEKVARCPALERKYWLAELPLMASANQMLGCDVGYQAYDAKLGPIGEGNCEVNRWVACLKDLWTALGVVAPNDVLGLDGFKAYLELAWMHGGAEKQAERCRKINNVDFDKIEKCVIDVNFPCKYPMLTLPDDETYELELRDPFDIRQLDAFLKEVCAPECNSVDVSKEYQQCINPYWFDVYPKDIIIGSYIGVYEADKCKNVAYGRECLRSLDQLPCVLFRNSIIQTKLIGEALDLCDNMIGPPTVTEVSGQGTVYPSAMVALASAIFAGALQ